MKTLHIDTGREMRGGQWQVLRLVRGLVARGQEPTLMAREDSPLYALAKAEGLPVCRLTTLGLPQRARHSRLVHAHDARAHTLAALFPRAPLVVSRRVAFPLGSGLLSRRKYRRATHFIAVSRYVAARLCEGGIPNDKISVVHDGVPLLPLTTGGSHVICPASNDPQKGVRLVIEAARLLRVQVFPSLDLERDLAGAAVFVYITHAEGLGSATLLAMSAGVPVVASRVGGLPEAIADEEEGLLVPNNPTAISEAIDRFLRNPEFARGIALRARRKVESQFSEGLMVEQTMAVYRRLGSHD
ncbi:MAG: glycosyltransferase family 4 protein [Acidobacteriota bacterium]|nr:glycosyltransferase family 4 protein [Acidobacteriota bacterium]